MKVVVFLILLKVFDTVRTTKISDEYDITTALNDTIAEIFQIAQLQLTTKLINFDKDSIDSLWSNNYSSAYIKNTRLTFNAGNIRVSYGFLDNKIRLYIPELVWRVSGTMPIYEGSQTYGNFTSGGRFDGYTISAIKQCNISGDTFLVDSQYNHMDIECNFDHNIAFQADYFYDAFPSMLQKYMKRNKKLLRFLSDIYDMKSTHITSKHRYFFGHENLYHFLIPNVSLESFNLKNIVVRHLSNFHSLNFANNSDTFTYSYTLLIKDIRGSMILEDVVAGRTTTSTLELHFFIASLSISVTQAINRKISVEGKNYSINSTGLNTSLTQFQPDLMDSIERAIGSSLMPTVQFQRTHRASGFSCRSEMENAIKHLLKENSIQSGQKNTKEPRNTWIPLDDKDAIPKRPYGIINNNYQLSFTNVTIIQFVSGNQPYPQQIQCPLPSNSEISHRINVIPSTKISGNNDKANSIDINFHFDLPFVNVSIIKRNNSMENKSCEFRISNNRDIQIHLSPLQCNTTRLTAAQLEMKNKIEASLVSMTKQRVVKAIKSMVCLPFDVCSQTAQMVNEFLSTFVDKVLQKCSLRRNAT